MAKTKHYYPGLERLRLILMLLMCIRLFGFPTAIGGWVEQFCGFVPIAFYILSGYLVLRESEHRSKRIVRAIKRTAIVFGVMTVVYFIINLFYYRSFGVNIFTIMTQRRSWVNFLVLNVWQFDIGGAIWYVQALLYAYIIIYFLDKWKLMKSDQLIIDILIIFAVATGELSGIIKWEWHGYTYIPGNFLTRALPYTLLGGYIHRKFSKFNEVNSFFYVLGIIVGMVLMFLEVLFLNAGGVPGYYGHLIGMPVVAVCVCMLAFKKEDKSGFEKHLKMSRRHTNWIYYLCQPVSYVLLITLGALSDSSAIFIIKNMWIATFAVSLALAWLISRAERKVLKKKAHENKISRPSDGDPDPVRPA